MKDNHDSGPEETRERSGLSLPNCPPGPPQRKASDTARSTSCRATADGSPNRRRRSSVHGRSQTVRGRRASADDPAGLPLRPCEGSTQPPQARQGASAYSGRRDPRQPHTEQRTRIENTMHEKPLRSPFPTATMLGLLLAQRRRPCPPGMNERAFRDREYAQLMVDLYRLATGVRR